MNTNHDRNNWFEELAAKLRPRDERALGDDLATAKWKGYARKDIFFPMMGFSSAVGDLLRCWVWSGRVAARRRDSRLLSLMRPFEKSALDVPLHPLTHAEQFIVMDYLQSLQVICHWQGMDYVWEFPHRYTKVLAQCYASGDVEWPSSKVWTIPSAEELTLGGMVEALFLGDAETVRKAWDPEGAAKSIPVYRRMGELCALLCEDGVRSGRLRAEIDQKSREVRRAWLQGLYDEVLQPRSFQVVLMMIAKDHVLGEKRDLSAIIDEFRHS
jgi:hypothetical protein